ncbi:leishmanolysin [Trypanosoma rangeli]|uniref:Leishmanolysin-like peptidase n=1 Tax=Trypanosoma rangeli TaxID=5698 RepID=A0A3R7M7P9_TRYRA|nr:leishmanolysin [Trypanosoma rangeli]RNE97672.1 leishmanolysin [Trypanosoma rangeli]|eukprot:RNE97672.1 leishmanolysin [Trypanosoma rangeli]
MHLRTWACTGPTTSWRTRCGGAKSSGCKLLENKCFINGRTAYPDVFCRQFISGDTLLCTCDRLSLGNCGLTAYQQPLPPEYQYFYSPIVGGTLEDMDYCLYVMGCVASGCTKGDTKTILGSFINPSSRCVKGSGGLRFDSEEIGDVCVNTQCSGGKLRVQFLGDGTWHDCNGGETVAPRGADGVRVASRVPNAPTCAQPSSTPGPAQHQSLPRCWRRNQTLQALLTRMVNQAAPIVDPVLHCQRIHHTIRRRLRFGLTLRGLCFIFLCVCVFWLAAPIPRTACVCVHTSLLLRLAAVGTPLPSHCISPFLFFLVGLPLVP